jgi:hypothetical protein
MLHCYPLIKYKYNKVQVDRIYITELQATEEDNPSKEVFRHFFLASGCFVPIMKRITHKSKQVFEFRS